MGRLKPIGSEKLTGDDKIKRMLEIARFKEATPSNINESSRTEFSIPFADGNQYSIVKEKQGYIIKKMISESTSDYIEPIKNRKYYSSYSQALKRLNLLAAEINRLNENEEGVSFFGEEKKYVLKTPKPSGDASGDMSGQSAPPPSPPPLPEPELPPSPDAGGEEMMPPLEGGDEEMPPLEGGDEEMPPLEGGDTSSGDEGVTFKLIQKLTGKLTQKIRDFDNEKGLTSENIKYVINMVLSSFDLNSLSEEDKEDIISKFEEDYEEDELGGMEDMGGEEMPDEEMPDEEMPSPEPELTEKRGAILDSLFAESKVNKVISKYFELTKREILENKKMKENRLNEVRHILNKKMKPVVQLSETIEQELASQKFLEENISYVFVGKTNMKNLVFEGKGKQVRISPHGILL